MNKICTNCKQEKSTDEFRKNKNAADGYQHYCKACASGKIRTAYDAKYAARVRARTHERYTDHRALIEKFKSDSGGCALCTENEPACLDFHHTDPTKKDFVISARNNRSIKSLLREIAKCIIVCRNCHAKIHADILACPGGYIDKASRLPRKQIEP